jgi:hypothetical protein
MAVRQLNHTIGKLTWPRLGGVPFTASSLTWAGPTSRRVDSVGSPWPDRPEAFRLHCLRPEPSVSAAEAMRNRPHGKRSAASSEEEVFQKALQREHSSKAAALHERRQVARFRHGKGTWPPNLI